MENPTQPTSPEPKAESLTPEKKPFTQPRLTFIYPRLVKHGDATKNTHAFIDSFSPMAGM